MISAVVAGLAVVNIVLVFKLWDLYGRVDMLAGVVAGYLKRSEKRDKRIETYLCALDGEDADGSVDVVQAAWEKQND